MHVTAAFSGPQRELCHMLLRLFHNFTHAFGSARFVWLNPLTRENPAHGGTSDNTLHYSVESVEELT